MKRDNHTNRKTNGNAFMKLLSRNQYAKMLVVICILLTMLLQGCSGKSNTSDVWMADNSVSVSSSSSASYGYTNKGEAGWFTEEAEAPSEAGGNAASDSSFNQNGEDLANQTSASERKLIKTVNLHVETLNFDESRAAINASIEAMGGYIEQSSESDYTYYSSKNCRYANYTIRIPGERLNSFVNAIGEIGNVTSQDMNTQDVTMSYLDVESRAKALEIQQERLLALLEKADSIEDIIALEERLSEVTYELEAKESTLKNYDNLVTYSTVYIYLTEVARVTVAEPETVGQRISSGLSDTFYNLGEGLKDFFVWFIVSLPYIVLWGVIIAVIVLIIVKITKGASKRKQKKFEKELQKRAAITSAPAQTLTDVTSEEGK